MNWIRKNHRILFYGCWLLLNIIQSAGTGLFDDEAYYWIYSKYPAWGYFDHPPMIGLLIKAGYAIFHNELGVRLGVAVMNVLTIFIIGKLLPRRDDYLFYLICGTMAVLQIGGIIAVPDIPLTFFTALFFLTYKNFLKKNSFASSLLLGLVMALMLYSKYHGILVILSVIISNPKIALKPLAYLAVFTGLVLFLPHLLWQYEHGFPSVQYHLFERNAPGYQFNFTIEYLLGQLALAGPLTGWLLLFAAFAFKPKDVFEKGLKYCMVGIYAFFLLSTAKGRVEANWTVPAFIPLIILSHQYLLNAPKLRRILVATLPVTLIIVFIARVYMLLDIAPLKFMPKDEFHKNQAWADSIKKRAGSHPVVFTSTYQRASKYWFYTGVPALSFNTLNYRRNLFNFLPIESGLFGKDVAIVSGHHFDFFTDDISTPRGNIGLGVVNDYYSFSKLKVFAPRKMSADSGAALSVTLDLICEADDLKLFQQEKFKDLPVNLYAVKDDHATDTLITGLTLGQIKMEEQKYPANLNIRLKPGIYDIRAGVPSAIPGQYSLNSSPLKLTVN